MIGICLLFSNHHFTLSNCVIHRIYWIPWRSKSIL